MRHDLCFLLLAAISLVVGVLLGIYMGLSKDFTLMPVHAHTNLLGWASLALFGLAYRAYPSLGMSWTATLHIALCGPSAILMPAGIALSIVYDSPGLAIGASLAWLAGSVTFFAKIAVLTARWSAVERTSKASDTVGSRHARSHDRTPLSPARSDEPG